MISLFKVKNSNKILCILCLLLLFSFSSFSNEPVVTECLDEHMESAIELNLERQAIYSRLSNGMSDVISEKIIDSEVKALQLAKLLMSLTVSHRLQGIPIGCMDFISMASTPKMSEQMIPSSVPVNDIQWFNFEEYKPRWEKMVRDLDWIYDSQKWSQLQTELSEQIKQLSEVPEYQCMTRHMLQVTLRSVSLVPYYDELQQGNLALYTMTIQSIVILSQIELLPFANEIDRLSAPLQKKGIPIVCQDVPSIPSFSKSEVNYK